MRNLKLFVKALRKNYYKEFIVSPNSKDVDFSEQVVLIEYKAKNYYERNFEGIRLRQNEILNHIKTLYKKALSDLYFDLAEKKSEEIYSTINFYTESLKINIETIQTDFFIDDQNSRYYSKLVESNDIKSSTDFPLRKSDLDELPYDGKFISLLKKWYFEEPTIEDEKKVLEDFESFYHLGFHGRRFKVISFLPFSLWHISNQFINDINKAKKIIEEQQSLRSEKMIWSGKRTHIGFILGTLASEGYIEPPRLKNGEINYTAFAKLIKRTFEVETNEDTLRKYLNPAEEKFGENRLTFEKEKYFLPNVKIVT
jgi:hypothetical protein